MSSALTPEHKSAAAQVARALADVTFYPAVKAKATIDAMIAGYRSDLGDLVQSLLRGGKRMSKAQFRRDMKATIKDYAREGFAVAWEEGGGDVKETEAADVAIIDEWRAEQQGFVDDFADWLTNKDSDLDAVPERLDKWESSFQNFCERVKLMAQGDPMLTYDGKPGEKDPCDECDEYTGQSHRLSWWEKNGLTKRNGNPKFTCGRWAEHCFHHFYNKKGEMVIE